MTLSTVCHGVDDLIQRGVSVSAVTLTSSRLLPVLVVAILLILVTGIAQAQEPSAVSGSLSDVDDSDFPEVRAIVTLVDASGRPVTGLNAEDFQAEETGARAQVTSVESVLDQQLGVAVVLVIDTSGSMEGLPIAQATNAARTFVENLAEPDQAAVISFAEGVSVESVPTSDRAVTLAALTSLVAVGNTALYSGVVEAVDLAEDATLPRKAIILLSDGQDFGGASQADRQEALDQAARARIPIYAIGLGQDIDRPFLEELANASGGAFIEAPAPGRIPEIYDQLSQLLRSQYVVTIQSTAAADETDRNLRLVVTTSQGQAEIEAGYTTSRVIVVPPVVVPTLARTPEVTPQLEAPQNAVPPPESSSGLPLLQFLLVVLAAAGMFFALGYYRRMKRSRALNQQIDVMGQRAVDEFDLDEIAGVRRAPTVATYRITVIGPVGEEVFDIGDEPVVLGSGGQCPIRVEAAEGVASEHARFWVRDTNLMLHHLAPGYQSLVDGHSVNWVSLERGDEVQIGPYHIRVDG